MICIKIAEQDYQKKKKRRKSVCHILYNTVFARVYAALLLQGKDKRVTDKEGTRAIYWSHLSGSSAKTRIHRNTDGRVHVWLKDRVQWLDGYHGVQKAYQRYA